MLDKVNVTFHTEHKDNSNYVRKLVTCSTTLHLDLFNTLQYENFMAYFLLWCEIAKKENWATCNQLIR